jgi:8-oxo-dGTP pyrophosphatase MutT (NUDIX family)
MPDPVPDGAYVRGSAHLGDSQRHSVSVAAVVVDGAGRVLVIQRRDTGRWEIPGGVLELGESIHDGLRREVREETGVLVNPGELTGVYKNLTLGVVALVFRATEYDGKPVPTDESSAVAWWTPDQIRETMVPAFAIRALDGLSYGRVAVRDHDGFDFLG